MAVFCAWTATEEAGGKAVQVVVAEDDHSFALDENALKSLLLDPRVRDRKIIILSVAGAYRKGKSFLLDFFLRYLYAKVGWQFILTMSGSDFFGMINYYYLSQREVMFCVCPFVCQRTNSYGCWWNFLERVGHGHKRK